MLKILSSLSTKDSDGGGFITSAGAGGSRAGCTGGPSFSGDSHALSTSTSISASLLLLDREYIGDPSNALDERSFVFPGVHLLLHPGLRGRDNGLRQLLLCPGGLHLRAAVGHG